MKGVSRFPFLGQIMFRIPFFKPFDYRFPDLLIASGSGKNASHNPFTVFGYYLFRVSVSQFSFSSKVTFCYKLYLLTWKCHGASLTLSLRNSSPQVARLTDFRIR